VIGEGDRMPARIRVAVLFGGRSTEHAISCVSAGSVLRALDRDRYDVVPIGITAEGRWVLAPDDPELLTARGRELPAVDGSGTSVTLPADPTRRELVVTGAVEGASALAGVDVVFPLLHGPYGEDGTVQGLLEMAGVPYVGSGVFSSAAAMDKAHMKVMLSAAGLPVGPYAVVPAGGDLSEADRARLGLPVFVKPARGGSSIGISKVSAWADLPAALAVAREADPKVVVEAAVTGREIECGVLGGLGGGPPEASVPAEVKVSAEHEFYDFEAKYLSSATDLVVPADLTPGITEQVQRLAVAAFGALDCAGLARVDVFVRDGDNSAGQQVIVNEVNTMPGFTPASLFPRVWAATGLDYPALIDRLLQLALERGTGLR
jgi:D-alanine-D-alanine ligase